MGLTDTHVHLCDADFDADRDAVIERAQSAGVDTILAVSETMEDVEKNVLLAAAYPGIVRPCAGVHPECASLEEAQRVVRWIRRHRDEIAAIGEVGLDHWKAREEADRDVQREVLAEFIDLSLELDLPLNVHSRSAGAKTIALLLERGAERVQLHAFDGRASKALPAVEAGYFFSIPPSVVRSPQKQKLVRRLPLDCLLLETDSPVLGPTRDERNEPANATLALAAIAEIKKLSEDDVRRAVRENTQRLYRF